MNTYHKKEVADILSEFSSSYDGLNNTQVDSNREQYGANILSEKKQTPLFVRFLLQFKNFFSMLLLTGSILSFIGHAFAPNQGNDVIGYALAGVTILNASFTFFQEYKAEQAMKSFKNLLPQTIEVIRNGATQNIEAKELVPGDIILLHEGDKIPADGRIIEEAMLKVDHSSLTGESEPQLRSTKATSDEEILSRNMVFSGTLVQSGTGKVIIVRTGDDTEIGRIAQITSAVKTKQSNIKRELAEFVKVISSIAIILGIGFFGLGLYIGMSFWQSIVFGIAIIVANVPEGLLPTVTLTLSIAAQKMAKKQALVKDIESIETLGSITTICTDKTGTLTENVLTVTDLHMNDKTYSYSQYHKSFEDPDTKHNLHTEIHSSFRLAMYNIYLCNNAVVQKETTVGDPTEIALKQIVATQMDTDVLRDAHREYEIPFDSEKKYMITASNLKGERTAYLKGSPEAVLAKCSHIEIEGKIHPLKDVDNIIAANKSLAHGGKRVLAVAYKQLDDTVANEEFLETNDYVYVGLVAMQDPPRKEVADAVAQCKTAGIRVIVISGDQGETIKAIAQQVGIAKDPYVLTSKELHAMDDAALRQLVKEKDAIIFARSLPKDKLRVVQALQDNDEIVAVTGDGVNDAPALKQANVGIAMGSGTDVARDASNIVLLDDNFATIIQAIKGGRMVFDNIKKFILYILTSNIPEILPFLFAVLLGWPLALPVLLILAIDLGTDVIPSISLGQETAESDIMKKPPRNPKTKLLTKSMLIRSYGVIGPLQALFSFIMFFTVLRRGGWDFGQDIVYSDPLYMSAVGAFFATIVIIQIFNGYACRSNRMSVFKKGFFSNRLYLLGVGIELVLLGLILFYPPIERIFGTLPFDLSLLIPMIGFGLFILLLEEVRKYITRTTGKLAVE